MKILIVDDSKTMRMIVMRHLRQAGLGGADLLEAANGTDALEQTRAHRPDLVLCDWNMPELNGLEVLAALRGEGNPVRFGFVTSESTPAMRALALSSGAAFLISKPFTAEVFEAALSGVAA